MNRKIFAWVMVLAMLFTMMPMPGVHDHAHAAEAECNHSWENYLGICDKCGAQHAHDACYNNGAKCSICKYDLSWQHPDYYPADGHCDACKRLLAYGHSDEMMYDTEYHWLDCEVCAEETKKKHTLVDGKCECGYVFVCEHPESKYVSDGNGKHTTVCVDCGANTLFDYYFDCTELEENVCVKCGYEKYHFPKTEATCTEAAVCKHCGESYGESLGHDWDNGVCIVCDTPCEHDWDNDAGQCTECGETHIHDACVVTASFGGLRNCSICGHLCAAIAQDLNKDGHCDNNCGAHLPGATEIKHNVTHHWEWCPTCEKIIGDFDASGNYIDNASYVPHSFVDGLCSVCGAEPCKHNNWLDGVCADCGAECEHDWNNYSATCTICGEQHIHTIGCGYVNGKVCDVCGYTEIGIIHPDYYPQDYHCDVCGVHLNYGENPVKKFDATHHWYECVCGDYIWGNDEEGDTKEEHTFDANGFCAWCEYQCDHEEFVFVHIEGTEAYKSMHDWLCPDCGYVLVNDALCYNKDETGDGICDGCKYEYEHKNCRGGEATCTEPAICEICGEPYSEALDHDWEDGVCQREECGVVCTHPTWEGDKCTVCGIECKHNYIFEHIEGTEGYQAIHDWYCPDCGYVLVNDALCYNKDENGDGICDGCKYEYEHKNCRGGEATCTEKAICEICGKSFGEANGHGDYLYEHIEGTVDKGSKHKATCEDCGEVIFIEWYCSDDDEDNFCDECGVQLHTHDWSNNDGICATCGEECEHANGHTAISNGEGQHMLKCPDCGHNFGGLLLNCENYDTDYDGVCNSCEYEIYHNWKNGDGICATCGEECEHAKKDKVISNGKGQHSLECPDCGYTYNGALLNCDDRDGDRFCDSCGYEVYHLHDWSKKDGICATCGEACEHANDFEAISNGEGKHMLSCPDCGYNFGGLLLNCENSDNDYNGVCDSCNYELYHTGGTPTCTEKAICQNCGEEYGEVLDHVADEDDGDCTTDVLCAVCDAVVQPGTEKHWWNKDYVCKNCGFTCEHENNTLTGTVPSTCEYTGLETYQCNLCGKTSYVDLPLAAHTPEADDGDCTTDVLCAVCDVVVQPGTEKHWWNKDYVCKNCGFTCEHESMPLKNTVPASCLYNGYEVYECELCGKTSYVDLPAGHKPADDDGNCTTAVKCTVCGIDLIEAKEQHNYEVVKSSPATCLEPAYFWYQCSECDWQKSAEDPTGALAGHDYEIVKSEPANCIYPAYNWYKCSVCGIEKNGEEGNALGHKPADDDGNCTTAVKCTVCGIDLIEAKEQHNYEVVKSSPATCLEPAYFWYQCSECDWQKSAEDPTGALAGHDYEIVKSEPANCIYPAYYWYECSVCGAEKNGEEGEATGLHIDLNNDRKCDVCGYKFAVDCDHEGKGTFTFTAEATCSAEGKVEVFCLNCEEVISSTVLPKNDRHFFYNGKCMLCDAPEEAACDHEGKGTYNFTVEANCSDEGVVEVYCAACSELISKTVLEKNDNHFFYNGKCMLCGETDECKHDFVVVKSEPATCLFPAYYWYECSKCGEEKNGEDTTGALADHKYEVVKTEEATCQYPAYFWYECSVCGAEKNYEDKSGKLGEHNYVVVKSEPATCVLPAYYWYECSVCGAEKNYEDKSGKLGEHNYVVVKSEPATCVLPTYYWYECSVCGAEKNGEDTTGALAAHDYEVVKSEPATCEYPAYYWYECSVCGAEKNGEEGKADASAHTWNEGVVTSEPTVDAEGVKTFTCTGCGTTKTEAIEKLAHAHDYKSVVTAPTCTVAGYTTYTCECGDSYTSDEVTAKGHTEETVAGKEATCTATGLTAGAKCSVCGEILKAQEEISAKGHTEETVAGKEATCTATGLTAGAKCSVCGETLKAQEEIPAKGHTEENVAGKEATCTDNGLTAGAKCSVCGETLKAQEEIAAKGHSYKIHWEFNDAITEKYKVSTCTDCGHVHKEGPFECDH